METTDQQAVLFLDMLGFATLTENHPLDVQALRHSQNPLAGGLDELLARDRNPLTRAFTSFHYGLKWAIDIAQTTYALTAITFSDSAFIATKNFGDCVGIAKYIVTSLLGNEVPVRIGIAYGSFAAVRFRSDVSADGGDHSAHFLGGGVVRAHAAESCGIKGIRILLHPSAAQLLETEASRNSRGETFRYLGCTEEECGNAEGVRYEVDYWDIKPTAEAQAWRALQTMWSKAPEVALRQYEATAQAINRMRVSRGGDPIINLRRVTLPRSKR